MKKALFAALVVAFVFALAGTGSRRSAHRHQHGHRVDHRRYHRHRRVRLHVRGSYGRCRKTEGGYVAFTGTGSVTTQVDDQAVVDNTTNVVTTTTNDIYTTSPHGGYDTTTNKCKVCHAVHRAEGAYYLLRADSQDDACSYCHIGQSAHSTKVVYDLNPAGIDTTNGHTIGAACSVPDSSVRQYAQPVTLYGVDCDGNAISEAIEVRAYDEAKLQMYRFGRHHGQSDEGTGRGGYAKIGPLNLRCMSCHQTHNAVDEVWRPLAWNWTVGAPEAATAPDPRHLRGHRLQAPQALPVRHHHRRPELRGLLQPRPADQGPRG